MMVPFRGDNEEFQQVLQITPYQQMASSLTGALTVSLFMTPLDVVKIRLQAQDRLHNKCFLYSNGLMDHLCTRTNGTPQVALHTAEEICNCKWYNRPKYFNGTVDAFAKIAKTEGLSSLWSGLSPTLILAVPTTVIYFTAYEQIKAKFISKFFSNSVTPQGIRGSDIPMWVPLVSGGLARTFAVTLVSPLPMDVIKTARQIEMGEKGLLEGKQKSNLTMVKEVVARNGTRGLFAGLSPRILKVSPACAIMISSYEYCKTFFHNHNLERSEEK